MRETMHELKNSLTSFVIFNAFTHGILLTLLFLMSYTNQLTYLKSHFQSKKDTDK